MELKFKLEFYDDKVADWYHKAELTEFKTESGDGADITKKLVVRFLAPGKIEIGDVTVSFTPTWHDYLVNIHSDDIGDGVFDYKITVTPKSAGDSFEHSLSKVHIGVNKSSEKAPVWSAFRESFVAAADSEPSVEGLLDVKCDDAPAGLETAELELRWVRGSKSEPLSLEFGKSKSFSLPAGTYQIYAASELKTKDGTLRAPAILSSKEIIITKGQSTEFHIKFGSLEHSSTIDVLLDLSDYPELHGEEVMISFKLKGDAGSQKYFTLLSGKKLHFEKLPVEGEFIIHAVDIRLNNKYYKFKDEAVRLDGRYHQVTFNKDFIQVEDDSKADALLHINVRAEKSVSKTFSLLLVDNHNVEAPRQYRFGDILAKSGSYEQSVHLAAGSYQVEFGAFVHEGIVYHLDVNPNPLRVGSSESVTLDIALVEGANLYVKGFPKFLSFGGCADMVPSDLDDFVEARVSSLFKYAGNDGAGDENVFLEPEKEPTSKAIKLAREVSAKLKDSTPVLPVMVSYTCNFSGGDAVGKLGNESAHKFSFANFIQALSMAEDAYHEKDHPVPAGFIVNPDFLGECQKHGFLPEQEVKVRKPLEEALAYHKSHSTHKVSNADIEVPDDITDTLKGYIKAVNWLVRIIAPHVVIGWQVNLWGVASSSWIYGDAEYAEVYDPRDGGLKKHKMTINPQLAGELIAKYALYLGVFEDIKFTRKNGLHEVVKGADFMAVDRYEADDFTDRGYGNGYCYSPYEWGRLFEFCASLSRHLRKPVMPWQIPASHLATKLDNVARFSNVPSEPFEKQHWGSGGSYLMGHPEIGADANKIHDTLLAVKFTAHPEMGEDAKALFSRHKWDLSKPKYLDFPTYGIFHVQLGGGMTTGVVSTIGDPSDWMRKRLHDYRDKPVMFEPEKRA
ncbi:hypothetical protein NK214_18535 [Chromobacterium sp. S0633]|uniref:hypothetical protein n=1 Tax=Chromobacterium sp. S0633 TaxID=2957805 RepID=UPI00209D601D|nr:hypothetical protein [Chromobacterium sp. S0633]MCP1292183.1 hypothetical protein [Chromobacterium sp. S0633]